MAIPGRPNSPCFMHCLGWVCAPYCDLPWRHLLSCDGKISQSNAWLEFWCLELLRKPDSTFAVVIPMNRKLSGVAEILGPVSGGCQEAESCVLSWSWTAVIQDEVEQNGKGSNNGGKKQTNFEVVHVVWWMQLIRVWTPGPGSLRYEHVSPLLLSPSLVTKFY